MRGLWVAPLLLAGTLLLGAPVRAQTALDAPTPGQIQAMIAGGQEGQAVQALQDVLQNHPKSAVAWYLLAEAYDAQNDENDAGNALNMAERSAPGLPFANPQEVAALRAHIGGTQFHRGGGMHTAALVIGGLALLLLVLRLLPGRGVAARNYGYTAPPPPPGTPPYGFGYGPQAGGGGGLGSAIIGGLAAGAGFAAGERIIDGLMDGNRGGPMFDQNQGPDFSRDDGLMGNQGWDDSGQQSDDNLDNTGWS